MSSPIINPPGAPSFAMLQDFAAWQRIVKLENCAAFFCPALRLCYENLAKDI